MFLKKINVSNYAIWKFQGQITLHSKWQPSVSGTDLSIYFLYVIAYLKVKLFCRAHKKSLQHVMFKICACKECTSRISFNISLKLGT